MDRHNHIQLSGKPVTVSARSIHSTRPVRVVHLDGEAPVGASGGQQTANRVDQGIPAVGQASEMLLEMLEGIQERLEQIDAARAQSLGELQQLAVRLSVAIAESVIRHELKTDTGRIASLVSLAMEQLQGEDPIRIFACSEQFERLETVLKGIESTHKPVIQADPKLRPGDIRIEGGTYGLESLVTDQLQSIQEKLLESLTDAETERRQAASENSGLGRFPNRRQGT